MDLQTFFALQRSRIGRLDNTELDQKIRKGRFIAAQSMPKGPCEHPDDTYHLASDLHYDSVKAGYRSLRMLYV